MESRKVLQLIVICAIVITCNAKYLISNETFTLRECQAEDLATIRDIFPAPKEIVINHCKVKELPNAIFIRFPMLKLLEISESHLSNIQDFAFNGLKNLETLILR
jgi:hypothetical protein